MNGTAIQQLREWAEGGGRGVVMGLPEAVLVLLEERAELERLLLRADELLAGMWSYNDTSRANLTHTWSVQASDVIREALTRLEN